MAVVVIGQNQNLIGEKASTSTGSSFGTISIGTLEKRCSPVTLAKPIEMAIGPARC